MVGKKFKDMSSKELTVWFVIVVCMLVFHTVFLLIAIFVTGSWLAGTLQTLFVLIFTWAGANILIDRKEVLLKEQTKGLK